MMKVSIYNKKYIEFSPLLEYKEELSISKMRQRRRSFDIIDREKILDQLCTN